jgi:penicillin-binding protein 1A
MAKRRFYRRVYKRKRGDKTKKASSLFRFLFLSFLFFFISVLSVFVYYGKDLPRPEKFTERQFIESTKIYDRTGEVLLYDIHGEEKRTYVSLEIIPDYLQKAVIAAEDSNFYSHFGIDLKAILRSVLVDLKIQKPTYGGSTIPQQLIRSTFLSNEKTVERKIREIILALELDRRHPKEKILEWYLNQVPFGSNAYGVEAASQTYFHKSVSEISLAQSAALASLIRAPSYLSPYRNKEELLGRKDYVLERMYTLNYITQEELESAKEEELVFEAPRAVKAPYFTLQYVLGYLQEKYSQEFLRESGLKVYTSLDWELQQLAEEEVQGGVNRNKNYRAYNAALTALDPKTGEILAMVGGKDYFGDPYPKDCVSGKDCKFDPQFNVATLGSRQPGSAFKPFVYATAFKKGVTPETTIIDELTNFGVWGGKEYIPKNYDGEFRGEITIRESLAQSINVTSVKVLLELAGPEIENSVKTAQDLGISTLEPPFGPSIVLGGWEVKLIDMVSAYGVFATEGLKVPPVAILRIEDSKGNIVEENKKTHKRVLPLQVARTINDILSDNEARAPMFGFNSRLYFPEYQVAAKTGTTQNYQDAWTVGYTPSIVVGVWVGNNDNSPMVKKPGVTLAGPIFHGFMEEMLEKYPKENFTPPEPTQTEISLP